MHWWQTQQYLLFVCESDTLMRGASVYRILLDWKMKWANESHKQTQRYSVSTPHPLPLGGLRHSWSSRSSHPRRRRRPSARSNFPSTGTCIPPPPGGVQATAWGLKVEIYAMVRCASNASCIFETSSDPPDALTRNCAEVSSGRSAKRPSAKQTHTHINIHTLYNRDHAPSVLHCDRLHHANRFIAQVLTYHLVARAIEGLRRTTAAQSCWASPSSSPSAPPSAGSCVKGR